MKYRLLLLGIWIGYVIANICIAELNDHTRRNRIKEGNSTQINHPLWAFIYFVLCAPMYLLFKDWFLILSLFLLHISVFPVAFNLFSGQPAFYLSKNTTALTDRLIYKMGFKSTEAINITGLFLSITSLVTSFFI